MRARAPLASSRPFFFFSPIVFPRRARALQPTTPPLLCSTALTCTQNRSRGHAISHAESMMAWQTARSLNMGSWTATLGYTSAYAAGSGRGRQENSSSGRRPRQEGLGLELGVQQDVDDPVQGAGDGRTMATLTSRLSRPT